VSQTEIEGMDLPKVSCLLFFSLAAAFPLTSEAYVVQKGDSLSSLAKKYQVAPEVLKGGLPDQDWDKLTQGLTLELPKRYRVVPGDTLYSLAKAWGVEIADIRGLNRLEVSAGLKSGSTLLVPERPKTEVPGFWPVASVPRKETGKRLSVSFGSPGSAFVSVSDGTVVFEGEYRGIGRVILVENPEKTVFGYANYESALVRFGQAVAKGMVLGKTSDRPAERLHFFATRQSEPLDPFSAKR